MRILLLAFMFLSFSVYAQTKTETVKTEKAQTETETVKTETVQTEKAQTKTVQTETAETQTVHAACGKCMFNLEGEKCALAVKIDGKAYFVDGASIGDHGDSHSADGLCKTIRDAEVVGEIVDGRFNATQFKLLPLAAKDEESIQDKKQE